MIDYAGLPKVVVVSQITPDPAKLPAGLLCDVPLTRALHWEEHTLVNALSGRLKAFDLLCRRSNSEKVEVGMRRSLPNSLNLRNRVTSSAIEVRSQQSG